MLRSILNLTGQTGMECALGGPVHWPVISRLQAEPTFVVLLTYLSVFALKCFGQNTQAPKAPEPSQISAPAVISRLQADHK